MDANSPLIALLIGVLLTLIGTAFIIGAIVSLIRARAFVSKAEMTEGVVVNHTRGANREYSAIVEFTPKGASAPIQFTDPHRGRIGFNTPGEGRQVTVAYDPQNPSSARINRSMNLYYAPLSLGVTAISLLCFGLALTAYGIFALTR